nr:hypothetical protein BgiMline_005668 [Biomphalaria glabrata]
MTLREPLPRSSCNQDSSWSIDKEERISKPLREKRCCAIDELSKPRLLTTEVALISDLMNCSSQSDVDFVHPMAV